MVGLTRDSHNCFRLLGDMLPLNNEMSLSMHEAKKTLSALCMEYQKIMCVLMIVFCIETSIRMLLHDQLMES